MTQNTANLYEKPDLTNCDREPIHIPGSIQPHGTLLVLAEPSMQIVQTGANAAALLGTPPEMLLGQSWEKAIDAAGRAAVQSVLTENLEAAPHYLPPVSTVSGKTFEAVVHRFQGVLILELEENTAIDFSTSRNLYASLKATLARLQEASSVAEFCRNAAAQVREFTGFDRVMIYRFAEEGSGEVVAESKRDELESFLGLNYPASDIPLQARALYLKSWLRFKVDNDAAPVALVPGLNPQTGAPLDMSHAALRSMSPIHSEYLRNMGVKATMSISIIRDNQLWGLVACHHYAAPRYVPHEARIACEFLAHSLSLQMAAKETAENHEYVDHLNRGHAALVEAMARNEDFIQGLLADEERFLNWIEAGGAAVVLDEDVRLLGKTPRAEEVRRIARWLDENQREAVLATDNLPDLCRELDHCREFAAGVLSVRLSRQLPHFILWFRPEIAQRVNWAGAPHKPVEKSAFGDRLTPRKSFDLWVEEVKGKSAPWKACEREAAANLRHSITEIIVRRAKDLADLNNELERSNFELDSFAYIASHDLKEPLRGIHNFSHILIETYTDQLPPEGQEKLRTLMRLTERMESLIESLLHYSRIGRTELRTKEIDLNRLVGETLEMIQARLDEARAELVIARNLPPVEGDDVLLREVLTNLLSNAVKYNDKETPRIEFGFTEEKGKPVFFVRDNGIGIHEKHHDTIFRIFKRLHGRDAYGGGIGAGLTITQKIIERHGGEIWLESVPQEGTTFYFTLKTREEE